MGSKRARARAAALAGIGVLAALAACGNFSGSDPGSSADGGGIDATTSDVATGAQTDAGSPPTQDAGPVVDSGDLIHDDFEKGTLGNSCAGWATMVATSELVGTVAHGGSNSCRVCMQGPNDGAIFRTSSVRESVSYTLDFWMAVLPDAGLIADAGIQGSGHMDFRDDGGTYIDGVSGTSTLSPNKWVRVQASMVAPKGSVQAVSFIQAFPSVQNDCVYVDDVRLYAQ